MSLRNVAFFLTVVTAAVMLVPAVSGAARAQEATASPAPAASQTPPPIPSPVAVADDPKIHKLAVQQFLAWQQGQIDRTFYSDEVNGELTDDVIGEASKTLANMGPLQTTVFRGISHAPQGDLYVYRMTCDKGSVDMDFSLDPKGKILKIYFN